MLKVLQRFFLGIYHINPNDEGAIGILTWEFGCWIGFIFACQLSQNLYIGIVTGLVLFILGIILHLHADHRDGGGCGYSGDGSGP